jgi:hypothetical protein
MSRLPFLIALAVVSCAPTVAEEPLDSAALETYPDARGMPADVQHFIVQWSDCMHWLGEPYGDDDRRRQIERAIGEVCPGVDRLGQRLRSRYAGNPEVLARIAELEPLGQ